MRNIVHLLRYLVKSTATDSPFKTQANCSKCLPSAWIHFQTRVTGELVTIRSIAALLILLAALRIRCSSSSRVFTLCGPRRRTKCYESYWVKINPTAKFQSVTDVRRFKMSNTLDMVRIRSYCV